VRAGIESWAAAVQKEFATYERDPDAATELALGDNRDRRKQYEALLEAANEHAEASVARADRGFEADRATARTVVMAALLVALVVALVVGVFVLRSIRGPLAQLSEAAERIAEGDIDQHVDVRTRDEIGTLGIAFRRMIDYLKEMAGAADRVAAGDLSVAVEPRSERDALGNALAGMTGSLRELIGSVSDSSGNLSAASQQMASTSDEAGRAVG
jgi:methyl-accepting chemotaxis protein